MTSTSIIRQVSFEQYEIDFAAAATQPRELKRVKEGIGLYVYQFCKQRLDEGNLEFTIEELSVYIKQHQTCAPDSASRILRLLRQDGIIRYRVLDRSRSLYIIDYVAPIPTNDENR